MRAIRETMRAIRNTSAGLAALALAGPAAAAGMALDLTQLTADPELEYILVAGAVMGKEAGGRDTALCLREVEAPDKGMQGLQRGDPVLVGYALGGEKGLEALIGPDGVQKGASEAVIALKVAGHNLELTPAAEGLECEDRHGILKQLGRQDLTLGDLHELEKLDLGLTVVNEMDGGRMVLEVVGQDLIQECHVPEDHQHVRYGAGAVRDLFMPGLYVETDSLIVCSAGIRICSFSGDFLEDPDHQAVIVGNALDNTIMLADSGTLVGAHRCDGSGKGGPSRYAIDDWAPAWEAGLSLYGEDGHDWIIDGPNDDFLDGGDGNDMLVGTGGNNFIYGRDGRDVMHGGNDLGYCSGGSPTTEHDCYSEGNWPYTGDTAGDCCCHSCVHNDGCWYSDITPGISDVPPTPW